MHEKEKLIKIDSESVILERGERLREERRGEIERGEREREREI